MGRRNNLYKSNCIAIAPFVDRLYVYDNSVENEEAQLLYRLSEGKLIKQYTRKIPEWAQDIIK